MATPQALSQLAGVLADCMAQGLFLSADTLFFLSSTYGITSAQELENSLGDRNLDDREVILELIFFPNRQLRLLIEPLLEKARFGTEDESKIAGLLHQLRTKARFIFPDNAPVVLDDIPPFILEHHVKRLYIANTPHPDICRALQTHLLGAVALSSMAALRCRQITLSDRKVRFLCAFIEKAAAQTDTFEAHFDLTVTLVDRISDYCSIADGLADHRKQLVCRLKRVREFEEKRDRYGMEYLLLSRYPVPTESQEGLREKIRMLDQIERKQNGF
jgi:hypothetical protein